jgi:hypothetical protein
MFKQEMMCEPCYPSERDQIVFNAYAEYIERTEQYDACICTGRSIDVAVPSNSFEMVKINKNANAIRMELFCRYDITNAEWRKAQYVHNSRLT